MLTLRDAAIGGVAALGTVGVLVAMLGRATRWWHRTPLTRRLRARWPTGDGDVHLAPFEALTLPLRHLWGPPPVEPALSPR